MANTKPSSLSKLTISVVLATSVAFIGCDDDNSNDGADSGDTGGTSGSQALAGGGGLGSSGSGGSGSTGNPDVTGMTAGTGGSITISDSGASDGATVNTDIFDASTVDANGFYPGASGGSEGTQGAIGSCNPEDCPGRNPCCTDEGLCGTQRRNGECVARPDAGFDRETEGGAPRERDGETPWGRESGTPWERTSGAPDAQEP